MDVYRTLSRFYFLTSASNAEWYTGMVYGYGSVMTYDGGKYDTNKVGQFLLTQVTTATSQILEVHIVRVSTNNI